MKHYSYAALSLERYRNPKVLWVAGSVCLRDAVNASLIAITYSNRYPVLVPSYRVELVTGDIEVGFFIILIRFESSFFSNTEAAAQWL